ncbi:MAG: 16S rRNA (adenine(1518)-N(6)/adenine(1519)-N(6))-dimethyltransferase RsmA [Anaerolineae bacterium]|nr:16S rRNA (adenine(1518)-N(6)/adenine(1519)-N(6))-dimethyltransferase RsmA [Anaerolineae bacterium]
MGSPLEPLSIPDILRGYGLRPSKGLGQNYLVDEAALARIAEAAEIQASDQVLEIGPGLGSLTRHLALAAGRVVAVEIDSKLMPPLREVLEPYPNVELVNADILDLRLEEHFDSPGYIVTANIPYYLTSAILRFLLESPRPPARFVLTVQEEVAGRITAAPGDMSLLALSVQVYGAPEIVLKLPAQAFFPAPKVDSAVVRIRSFEQPRIPRAQLDIFFRMAKAAFRQKRKTLANSLSAGLALTKPAAQELLQTAAIDPMTRPQRLSLDEWARLAEVYHSSSFSPS